MKQALVIFGLLGLLNAEALQAQDQLSRKDCLKYAFVICADPKNLQTTAITTDVDIKQPAGVKAGGAGAMVLPEAKLSAEAISKAGEQVVPLGQLWLYRLAPMREGQAVPSSQLRLVTVEQDSQFATLVQCALGVKAGANGLELQVYGKDPSRLLSVPLKKVESQSQSPIGITAERIGDSGKLTLKILGKYEAPLMVTEIDL
jgi:hypothetical protein